MFIQSHSVDIGQDKALYINYLTEFSQYMCLLNSHITDKENYKY